MFNSLKNSQAEMNIFFGDRVFNLLQNHDTLEWFCFWGALVEKVFPGNPIKKLFKNKNLIYRRKKFIFQKPL